VNRAIRTRRQTGRTAGADLGFGLALAVVAIALGPALGRSQPDLNINVRVYDYAQVPGAMLASAEAEARRILNAAGVDAVWLACYEPRAPSRSVAVPGHMAGRLSCCGFCLGLPQPRLSQAKRCSASPWGTQWPASSMGASRTWPATSVGMTRIFPFSWEVPSPTSWATCCWDQAIRRPASCRLFGNRTTCARP
jgi:hypothetical protein